MTSTVSIYSFMYWICWYDAFAIVFEKITKEVSKDQKQTQLRDQVRKTGEGARSCLNVLANSSCFLFANFSCILFLYFSVINKCIRVNTPQFTEEEVVAQLNTTLESRVLFGVPVFIPIICWYFSCGGSESLGLLSFVGSLALHPISELRFGLWVNISPNMENKLKLCSLILRKISLDELI